MTGYSTMVNDVLIFFNYYEGVVSSTVNIC